MTYQGIPSGVVQTTIYPAPYYPIYKAYQTIGGWVVLYLQDRYTSRSVDGGKVHKSRQNAYAKAKRMNDALKRAVKKTGMAEAEYGSGYVANVQDDQGEFGIQYSLTLRQDMMPPFETKFFDSLKELEQYVRETLPQPLNWQAIKPEEV